MGHDITKPNTYKNSFRLNAADALTAVGSHDRVFVFPGSKVITEATISS